MIRNKIDFDLIIYIVCFFSLMFVDWNRTCGGAWEQSNLYTGIVVAVFSLLRSDLIKKNKKRFFFIFIGIVCLHIGFHALLVILKININWNFELILLNVVFCGSAIVTLVYHFIKCKNSSSFSRHILSKINVLWVTLFIFILLGVLSQDETQSSEYTLLFMIVLFLSPSSTEDNEKMITGLRLGIISFFWTMQCIAFVFRPYVVGRVRYSGMYNNSNLFALSCLLVLVVSFSPIIKWVKSDKKINKIVIAYFINICAMLSFAIFSIGRLALFLAFCFMILFFILFFIASGKNVKKSLFYIIFSCILFGLICPVLFVGISYIPRILKHPISVYDDYRWVDLENSDNYIDAIDFESNILMRGSEIFNKPLDEKEHTIVDPEYSADKEYELYDYSASGIQVRKAIWKTYLKNLNLQGHLSAETILFYSPYKLSFHAHNIFIQIAYVMGIPAGIVFFIYCICLVFYEMRYAIKSQFNENAITICGLTCLLFAFGFFELSYMFGQILWFFLLITPLFISKKSFSV